MRGPASAVFGSVCSCECAVGFVLWLPGWAPTSWTHFAGEGPAAPAPIIRPAVQRPGSHWAGGLSPFSVSLTRASIAASFILSQRPGPPGLLCQSFCGPGKPYFLSSRQAQRATQSLLLAGAPVLTPGERHGVTQHQEKKTEGSVEEGQTTPLQET